MKNIVFIGASLDGYIADKDGGLDFLYSIPNPDQKDLGYLDFIENINALLYRLLLQVCVHWYASVADLYPGKHPSAYK